MEVQEKIKQNALSGYLKKLQFLTPHVATRASVSNIDLVSIEEIKTVFDSPPVNEN